MTIIFEVSRPFQARPGRFRSRLMYRFWWLYFAVGILRIPYAEYEETPKYWKKEGGW